MILQYFCNIIYFVELIAHRKAEIVLNLTTLFKKEKRILALILIAILMMAPGLSAIAETVITTETARAYQMPSTSAPSITVPAGTTMEKTAQQNGWVRVERAGRTAYMSAASVVEITNLNGMTVYAAKATPMYKAYGNTAIYGTLSEGAALTAYAATDSWVYASYAGKKGFVKKADLTANKPSAAPVNPAPEASKPEVTITKGKYAYAKVEGAKVYKSYSTSSRVLGSLPVNTKLGVGAVCGDWAFVGLNGFYGFMPMSSLSDEKVPVSSEPATSPSEDAGDTGNKVSTTVPAGADLGKSSTAPARGTAQAMDWWKSDIQTIFARGTTATITDVATGIAWKEIRKGGTNHADVQPVTAADTAAMKAAVGKWSWDRRAIFVTIDGVNYAASMNAMPHGSGSIQNNNFNGHHCIHFTNSRGHSSNKVCSLHQAAIQKALSAKL